MVKKECKHNNSDDVALFRNAVGETRPLSASQRHLPEKPKPKARNRPRSSNTVAPDNPYRSQRQPDESDLHDSLSFQRGLVTRRMMRDLRRGNYQLQAEIDLHGCTRDTAHQILLTFIESCSTRGLKCVRVVHGKGHGSGPDGPVLKLLVNKWLRNWLDINAFCPAQNRDGGSGALYVLLDNQ
jgi:DNA-nicking Smr family endonuclease